MENIVEQTSLEIMLELERLGIRLGTWEQDIIQKILVLAFNRSFQEGRSAGLKEVMRLLVPGGKGDYPIKP